MFLTKFHIQSSFIMFMKEPKKIKKNTDHLQIIIVLFILLYILNYCCPVFVRLLNVPLCSINVDVSAYI